MSCDISLVKGRTSGQQLRRLGFRLGLGLGGRRVAGRKQRESCGESRRDWDSATVENICSRLNFFPDVSSGDCLVHSGLWRHKVPHLHGDLPVINGMFYLLRNILPEASAWRE
jgi:hypothetical protein